MRVYAVPTPVKDPASDVVHVRCVPSLKSMIAM
jgi:hypothetical protein